MTGQGGAHRKGGQVGAHREGSTLAQSGAHREGGTLGQVGGSVSMCWHLYFHGHGDAAQAVGQWVRGPTLTLGVLFSAYIS